MNLKKACRISAVIAVIIAVIIIIAVSLIGEPDPQTRALFDKILEFYYLFLLMPVFLSLAHNIQHKKKMKDELDEDDNWD